MPDLQIDRTKLEALCREYHVKRLALFGSRTRGEERPDSDLDVLVEFEEGGTPGLKFFRLERELSELLGYRVDLNTPKFLSPYFRDEVMAHVQSIYAA